MYIALGVEYNGNQYNGFQRQKDVISIQGELEKAISKVAAQDIQIVCAGRTDAGVHATGQVINFACEKERKVESFLLGVNANLPKDIAITWAKEVPEEFHARFSATARRYRYIILNTRHRPGVGSGMVSHFHFGTLDADLMHEAAQCLIGEHDFTTFRGVNCQSKTPMRDVHFIKVYRMGDYVIVDIAANAFLLHMVRNIVGSLLEIGCGKKDKEWLAEIFAKRNRQIAAATAPSDGLYLVDVTYPAKFRIPRPQNVGPLFLI